MYLIKEFKAAGILPAGLVLNTRLDFRRTTEAGKDVIGALPTMTPLDTYGLIPIPQATEEQMIQLEGEVLAPVLTQPLSMPKTYVPFVADPLSDPCVLLCNMPFRGTIRVFAGEDSPKHRLTARDEGGYWLLDQNATPSWYVPRSQRAIKSVAISVDLIGSLRDVGYQVSASSYDITGGLVNVYGDSGLLMQVCPLILSTDASIGMKTRGKEGTGLGVQPYVPWTTLTAQDKLPADPWIFTYSMSGAAVLMGALGGTIIESLVQPIAPICTNDPFYERKTNYYVIPTWA